MKTMKITSAPAQTAGHIVREQIAGLAVDHIVPEIQSFPYPLVFVPGMWSGSWIFRKVMTALADLGYECYALNLRGHCGSKHATDIGTVSIDDYIEDVRGFVNALGCFENIILCGHSMGELIVSQVVPGNSSIVGHIGMTSAPGKGVMMGWETIKRMPKYLGRMIGSKPLSLTGNDARDVLFNTLGDEDFAHCFAQTCPESGHAAWEITRQKYGMQKLSVPSLLIGAKQDKITPNQRPVAKKLGAIYKEVDCCHMLTLDPNYMEVVSAMEVWLNREFMWDYV